MRRRCWSAAVALPDARVFVLGGCVKSRELSSVEMCQLREPADWEGQEQYQASDGFWTFAAPMLSGRDNHAAIAFRDCLFVAGGTDGRTLNLDSVDVFYPPDDRTPFGQWTRLANQNLTWHDVSLVVWQDRLFAFGKSPETVNKVYHMILHILARSLLMSPLECFFFSLKVRVRGKRW
ncbi:unnamed protein product [Dibothriocephalus latus]|uniref:Kelch repeat protein n=1 Tax=Dibothriocephalus latus TaxID=60516 RepID=A0A3P7RR19_DIBLA|nr:unnamed protein product [Dibothriocephalus latus]